MRPLSKFKLSNLVSGFDWRTSPASLWGQPRPCRGVRICRNEICWPWLRTQTNGDHGTCRTPVLRGGPVPPRVHFEAHETFSTIPWPDFGSNWKTTIVLSKGSFYSSIVFVGLELSIMIILITILNPVLRIIRNGLQLMKLIKIWKVLNYV